MSYQQIIIEGRIGSDVELRRLPDGTPVATFSVAHNTQRKGETHVVWHRVTAWRKDAENASRYLAKGREVLVEGGVEARAFMGNDGQPRAALEVVARRITFVGSRQEYEATQPIDVDMDETEAIPF